MRGRMADMNWRKLQQHGLEIAIALAIIYALYALGLFRPTDIGSAKHWHELKSKEAARK